MGRRVEDLAMIRIPSGTEEAGHFGVDAPLQGEVAECKGVTELPARSG